MYYQGKERKKKGGGGRNCKMFCQIQLHFQKVPALNFTHLPRIVNKPELHIQFSSDHAVNTHYFHCKAQSVNAVPENSCHLFRSQCKTHKYTVQAEHRILSY